MLKDFKNIEEFTIEINPETLTKEKALLIKEAGVNRCSIGVESFDENILKILGRSHTKIDVYNAIKYLKEVGISNINIDLIFATPGSDLSSIENDLKEFYALDINHLSYYSLILEENTIFYSMYKKNKLVLIDNDLEAKMYEFIINNLEKNGFKQYEISNFTKDGYESVHNKIYWLNKEYIGVGLGASGYLDGVRYTNNTVLNEYYKKYRKSIEIIDFNTKFSEEMILGLRLSRGINIEYVNKTYKKDLLKDFKDIEKYIKSGDLVIEDGYLHLTKKGMLIANDIFVLFI